MATKAASVSLKLFSRPQPPDPREKRHIAQ